MYEINWNELLSTVVQAVLMFILPIVAKYVVDWLKAATEAATASIESYQPDIYATLKEAAIIAVQAAEQYGLSDKIQSKKDYALDIAEKWLAERGFKIDIVLIDAAIEAQVGIFYPHDTGASPAEIEQR